MLLEEGAWQGVAPLMDEIWYVDIDDALRTDRLTSRHQQFGRSLADAQQWVKATDEPNAQLIAATRTRADLVFRW